MNIKETEDIFAEWNPIRDDYKNEFNAYDSGSVSGVCGSKECGFTSATNIHNKKTVQSVPYIVLKNVPECMTTKAVYNICSPHGKVTSINTSAKNSYVFVKVQSIGDREAIYNALLNNDYGIVVMIGKNGRKTTAPSFLKEINDDNVTINRNLTNVPFQKYDIDLESRTIIVSSKLHPRPQVPLSMDMDAHTLERAGVSKFTSNSKYEYCTGRVIAKMSEKTEAFIIKKNADSKGHYSYLDNIYSNCKSMPKSKFGLCNTCQRLCDVMCSRCSVYYCGKKCQKEDWPRHRYICGRQSDVYNPVANELKPKSELSSKQNFFVDASNSNSLSSNDIVQLISVSTPNVVYVRSKAAEIDYFRIINNLQNNRQSLKPLNNTPKLEEVVIVKYKNNFSRAQVLNIRPESQNVIVYHIDYGTIDHVKAEDLYVTPEEYTHIPKCAIRTLLKDVPDCYMTNTIRETLYSYLNCDNIRVKYDEKDCIDKKDTYVVTLIDMHTEQSINEKIRKLALPKEPGSNTQVCLINHLDQKPLPIGNNVELIVMDNSLIIAGSISCTTKLYAMEIQKFQTDIQRYGDNVPKRSYAPRVNELCIAKYNVDNKWYRGCCLELVGDGHPSISFIDYGNIAYVHIDNIRRYPPEFTFPILTADCEIEGLSKLSNNEELVSKLEELIPNGSVITCDHVKSSDNHGDYSILLSNILSILDNI